MTLPFSEYSEKIFLENKFDKKEESLAALNIERNSSNDMKTISLANQTFFYRSDSIVKSPEKEFSENTLDSSINMLIYGFKIRKVYKKSFSHSCIFYIHEDNLGYLQWISSTKKIEKSRIELSKIKIISVNSYKKHVKKKMEELSDYLLINYINNKSKEVQIILKFENSVDRDLFWQGLLYFIREYRIQNVNRAPMDMIASKLFIESYPNCGKVSKKPLIEFLKRQNIKLDDKFQGFLDSLPNDKHHFGKQTFKLILKQLLNYDEIIPIFSTYCTDIFKKPKDKDQFLTIPQLKKFFIVEQNQIFENDNYFKKIINIFDDNKKEELSTSDKMSLSGFRNMLFSINNQIFDINKMKPYQDMTKPLSNYYIKSSHNTYLMSNQIIGKSSVEAYIQALSIGCRCIELDTWDGDHNDPIIYHGYTLTTKILLKDVVQAIFDYGFVKNYYPIILSIENHCSQAQQKVMSEIFRTICGDSLYILPDDYYNYSDLPSPDELRFKILVKSKIDFGKKFIQRSTILLNNNKDEAFNSKIIDKLNSIKSSNSNLNISNELSPENLIDIDNESMKNGISQAEFYGVLGLDEKKSQEFSCRTKSILILNEKFDPKIRGNKKAVTCSTKNETLQNEQDDDEIPNHTLLSSVMQSSNMSYIPNSKSKLNLNYNVYGFNKKSQSEGLISNLKSPSEIEIDKNNIKINLECIKEEQEDKITENYSPKNYKYKKQNAISPKNLTVNKYLLNFDDYDKNKKETDIKDNKNKTFRNSLKPIFGSQNLLGIGNAIARTLTSSQNLDCPKLCSDFLNIISLWGIKMEGQTKMLFSVSSLNEDKINKIFFENEKFIIEFNKKYLTRIYPTGKRIDSSNYDPIIPFFAGAQMIALNMQTNDLPLLIYNSKFIENGDCNGGYVLKPDFLINNNEIYPKDFNIIKNELKIIVISGQNLNIRNNKEDFYFEVCIRGCQLDEESNKIFKSDIIKKDKFNPIFNFTTQFQIRCPKLCFILFQIYSKKDLMTDPKIAWYCLPFDCIRVGYRIVPLLDSHMSFIENSCLFCKIEIISK